MYYNLLNNHLNDLRMAMVIVVWWVFMHQLGIVYVLQSGSTYRQQAQTSTFPLYTTYSVLKKSNFWYFKIYSSKSKQAGHICMGFSFYADFNDMILTDEHFSSLYNALLYSVLKKSNFRDFKIYKSKLQGIIIYLTKILIK